MNKKSIIFVLTVLAILVIGGLIAYSYWPEEKPTNGNGDLNGEIKITSPAENESVSSPLRVEGEARGNWYFEATFPIKLFDAEGDLLVQSYATAEGDWMTEDFVSFSAEIEFDDPGTETGTLVLEKANPSGLEENADSIEIPIKFNLSPEQNLTSQEVEIKETAESWIKASSPTYKFDGSDLIFKDIQKLDFDDCPECYIVEFDFKSSHAGYGNRAGQSLAEVITSHTMTLLVNGGEVSRAVTDAKFNEVTGEIINLGIN